jgi:cellulose synthase/poly-beta-1,6-N-acetylglucosamine synthase-like glycosyltransferase
VHQKKLADEDERNGVAVKDRKQAPSPLTFMLQRVNRVGEPHSQLVRIKGAKDRNDDRFLSLALVIKSLNRRKHNSQEWMFSFAKFHRSDYVFLTDCGTLFGQGCLLRLVAYMKSHEKCVGCTGRQRVMSAADQDCEDEGMVESFFRLVQTADYEGSYAIYTGAFSLIGFLPVLPGPCCMLRLSALTTPRAFRQHDPLEDIIKGDIVIHDDSDVEVSIDGGNPSPSQRPSTMDSDEGSDSVYGRDSLDQLYSDAVVVDLGEPRPNQETALEHFSRLVATPPSQTNLVIEGVKLAEDRIPSYALVTHGTAGSYTTWVDGAIFYFQAETTLEAFAKQRRRWINGAMFSYVWLGEYHESKNFRESF